MPALVEPSTWRRRTDGLWSVEVDRQHLRRPATTDLSSSPSPSPSPSSSTPPRSFGAAALVFLIPGTFRAAAPTDDDGVAVARPVGATNCGGGGLRWLWRHPLCCGRWPSSSGS